MNRTATRLVTFAAASVVALGVASVASPAHAASSDRSITNNSGQFGSAPAVLTVRCSSGVELGLLPGESSAAECGTDTMTTLVVWDGTDVICRGVGGQGNVRVDRFAGPKRSTTSAAPSSRAYAYPRYSGRCRVVEAGAPTRGASSISQGPRDHQGHQHGQAAGAVRRGQRQPLTRLVS